RTRAGVEDETDPWGAGAASSIFGTGSGRENSPGEKKSGTGTSRSNTSGGVAGRNTAPAMAPATLGTISQYMCGAVCRSSRRYPHTAPNEPGHTAAVFVALAMMGGTPSQISVGKLMSEPPKANALMALATKPTAKMMVL